ncbi:4987_t:CDS:2 [Acaulospora morrowiae]|uniref:4987_t:CDS:1 n=1 Tax=Acaulospora morrowiae TaxID=94023 RepID=A0A9N8W0N5_9GLOM|nr:4987_t:CDS:2 [Acaulospora morrowiae]
MGTFTDKRGLENNCLEVTFIAIFAHLIIWATLVLFSEFVRRRRVIPTAGPLTSTGVPSVERVDLPTADQMDNRYRKVADAARDSLLMLLIATFATQVGYGATAASAILSWIFFGLSVCWVLSILFLDHIWIPLILQAVSFPFILAIFALAFRNADAVGNPRVLIRQAHGITLAGRNGFWFQ